MAESSAKAKKISKKPRVRKRAAVMRPRRARVVGQGEPGFDESPNTGLLVPTGQMAPITPSKLRRGFSKAKAEINAMLAELAVTLNEPYTISEVELTLSFNAKGEFLGIGVGGAASVKVRLTPTRE
ncbi:MAG: hypothetical protein U0263_19350 [Polyangiaceae bacterium]